jgi:hypothetical protein
MVKYFIAFVVTLTLAFAQISTFIPEERTVDWTTAGLLSPPPPIAREYTVATAQELRDSLEAKDPAVMTLIHLNAGQYDFSEPLRLQPNTIIKGQGSEQTTLVFHNLNNTTLTKGIVIQPRGFTKDSTHIENINALVKGATTVRVSTASNFSVGDCILLLFNSDNVHAHSSDSRSIENQGDQNYKFVGQMNRIFQAIFLNWKMPVASIIPV